MGMAIRRSAVVQLPSLRIVVALILTIGILASQAVAKPQSRNDQLEEIRVEDSRTEGHESFFQNTTMPFPDTVSRIRRHSTPLVQSRYTLTPGVGMHLIHTQGRTWHEAREICQTEGGDLAVINSRAESLILAELMAKSYPHPGATHSSWIHIGFHDLDREGNYVTVDGKSLTEAGFAEWAPGEPNNWSRPDDCGSIWSNGRLNDISCDWKCAFACELPIPEQDACTGLAGPPGIQGIKGDAGIPGPAGIIGQRGEPGAKGMDGLRGLTGPHGLDGQKGDKGDIGNTGPPGPLGPVGPTGSHGTNGAKGDSGSPGLKGAKGDLGVQGPPGPSGPVGSPGSAGEPGVEGNCGTGGAPGAKGPSGPPGAKGEKGSTGETGAPGSTGQKGNVGDRGPVGPSGPQGEKGASESGPPGAPGRRGEPGLNFDAVCLGSLPNDGEANAAQERCFEFIAKVLERMTLRASSYNPVEPDGSEESPAKTCKELFTAHPDKPSGEYWIDPNEGGTAILVHCDAEKRETCVTPELSRFPNMSYTGDEREVWLSEIEDGMQIKYIANTNQITALQALSTHAEQNVSYHCVKSVGYFDVKRQTNERGLKLLTWNDVELAPRGSLLFRYEVIFDECRDRLDEWRKTVVSYRTDKPARLPVMDVYLRDVGRPNQQFSVEIGKVCFK